jgi:hypothetical protein
MTIETIPSDFLYNFDFSDTILSQSYFQYNFFLRDEAISENVTSSIDDKLYERVIIDQNDNPLTILENNSGTDLNKNSRYIHLSWINQNIGGSNGVPRTSFPQNISSTIPLNESNILSKVLFEEDIENYIKFDVNTKIDFNLNTIGNVEIPTTNIDTSNVRSIVNASNIDIKYESFTFLQILQSLFDITKAKGKSNSGIQFITNENALVIRENIFRTYGKTSNEYQNQLLNVNNYLSYFGAANIIEKDTTIIRSNTTNINTQIIDQLILENKNENINEEFLDINRAIKNEGPFDINSINNDINHIGYLILRKELNSNNQPKIILIKFTGGTPEDITNYVDKEIKYGVTYEYSIRTLYTINLIDFRSSIPTKHKFIFGSRPDTIQISCVETEKPIPPRDFIVTYDKNLKKVKLKWNLPPNRKRDIKGIQVLRRNNLNSRFELMRVFDFNDTVGRGIAAGTNIVSELIDDPDNSSRKIQNPSKMFYDDNFNINNSYIYALRSIDAHGNISNLSEQIYVKFDRIKNNIMCKHISPQGAEVFFPNKYINENEFKEFVEFSHYENISVILNPDIYKIQNVIDGDNGIFNGNITKYNSTTTDNNDSYYKLFILNKDINDYEEIDININKILNI